MNAHELALQASYSFYLISTIVTLTITFIVIFISVYGK